MQYLHKILNEDQGQDLTEYGLLAAFISVVAVVTVRNIGPLVTPLYEMVERAFF